MTALKKDPDELRERVVRLHRSVCHRSGSKEVHHPAIRRTG